MMLSEHQTAMNVQHKSTTNQGVLTEEGNKLPVSVPVFVKAQKKLPVSVRIHEHRPTEEQLWIGLIIVFKQSRLCKSNLIMVSKQSGLCKSYSNHRLWGCKATTKISIISIILSLLEMEPIAFRSEPKVIPIRVGLIVSSLGMETIDTGIEIGIQNSTD